MAKKDKKPKPVKKSAVKKRGGLRPTAVAKKKAGKPAVKKYRPAYKPQNIPECTIVGALTAAFAEIEALKDEMGEIVDNMSGMEHLPKYEVAENAQSELDGHEMPDYPEALNGLKIATLTEMVSTRKGRAPGRATRLSNAMGVIEAVHDFLENLAEDVKGQGPDTPDAVREAAKAYADELEEHYNFDVEFPGMYG